MATVTASEGRVCMEGVTVGNQVMGVVDSAVHTSPSIDRAPRCTLAMSEKYKLPLTAGNPSAQYSAESVKPT